MTSVTVLMPTYNGMPYLKPAVESILTQTLRDLTLLIIDDGSTDGTLDYLRRLGDARVQVHSVPHGGLGAALNIGVDLCTSEFIARMDADDIALPRRLELQLAYLTAHKDVGLVGTQIAYCGRRGTHGFSPPLSRDHEDIVAGLVRMHHSICHGSIMCRTDALRRIGKYRVNGAGQDWDMFLRMSEHSRLSNLNDVLYLYRLHSQSVNAVHANHIRMQRAYACECARQRSKGELEHSFDDFIANAGELSVLKRASRTIDIISFEQYRRGIADILDNRRIKGYGRLLLAAGISPKRVAQRLKRAIHSPAFGKSARVV